MTIAGDVITAIGIVFILFGVVGFIKYKDFYTRILVTAKIDTVGTITIIIGTALRHGLSFFSAKAVLLMIILLLVTPLATHMIVRAAYTSGLPVKGPAGSADSSPRAADGAAPGEAPR